MRYVVEKSSADLSPKRRVPLAMCVVQDLDVNCYHMVKVKLTYVYRPSWLDRIFFPPRASAAKPPTHPPPKRVFPISPSSTTHPLTHLLFFEILLVYFFIVLWSAANVVGAWTLLSRELRL